MQMWENGNHFTQLCAFHPSFIFSQKALWAFRVRKKVDMMKSSLNPLSFAFHQTVCLVRHKLESRNDRNINIIPFPSLTRLTKKPFSHPLFHKSHDAQQVFQFSHHSFSHFPFYNLQDESSVQSLIDSCIVEDEKLYICVSSPTIKNKPVQIRPWRLSDADYVFDASMSLDPRKTVFVGGVPRPLKACKTWTKTNWKIWISDLTLYLFSFIISARIYACSWHVAVGCIISGTCHDNGSFVWLRMLCWHWYRSWIEISKSKYLIPSFDICPS